MTPRNLEECLDPIREALFKAKSKAEEAEWTNNPNQYRLREEYELLRKRYGDGEHHAPKF